MAPDDEEDDVYDDEFDFVDDEDDADEDDDDSDLDEDADDDDSEIDSDIDDGDGDDEADDVDSELDAKLAPREAVAKRGSRGSYDDRAGDADRGGELDAELEGDGDEEPVDEYGRPAPPANYVVHIYEYRQFKRTIDRPFTGEDAEAFASEYNRTSKSYGRFAIAGKDDAKPRKSLD